MNELERATVDELLEELAKRHTGLVVIQLKDTPGSPDEEEYDFIYFGGFALAMGLVERTRRRMVAIDKECVGDE